VTFLSVLTALSLVLTACGGDDDDAAGSGDTTDKTESTGSGTAAADKNDTNPASRDEVKDGGTLTEPIDAYPANFNGSFIDGSSTDTSAVMGHLLPSFFNFDAAGSPEVNKDFLVTAELTAETPKQIVTYKLNPEAVWYDGDPITVADFQAEWKALNGTNEAYKVSSTQGYDKIESVEQGADEHEVVITFKEPYTDWQALFGGMNPESLNKDPAKFNDAWREQPDNSAGPFKLGGVDKTAQVITLVRNEKWWGNPAKLEKIIYRVVSIDAQVDSLANGEIDDMDVGPDVSNLRRAEKIQGVDLRKAGGPNYRHLTFGSKGILADVAVRRALAMAINRDTIAEAILKPLGVEAVPLGNHIFMRNQKGYKDNSGATGKFDPDAAKDALDEAGWELDGKVRKKDGKTLAVRFVIPTTVPISKQEATLIKAMLGAVGVTVNIDTVPVGDFFEQYIRKGDFDLTLFSWIGTPFPISSSRSIYRQPKDEDPEQNYGRIGSAKIDQLFEQATKEFDRAKAIDLANQIDAQIWREVHSMTLYQRPEIIAAKSTLANLGAFGFASQISEDVGYVASAN
jgi:peptide/nickel transport system substrate-binding protein